MKFFPISATLIYEFMLILRHVRGSTHFIQYPMCIFIHTGATTSVWQTDSAHLRAPAVKFAHKYFFYTPLGDSDA